MGLTACSGLAMQFQITLGMLTLTIFAFMQRLDNLLHHYGMC